MNSSRFSKKLVAVGALIGVAFGYTLLSIAVRLMGNDFGPMTQVYMRLGLGCILAFLVLRRNIRWSTLRQITFKDSCAVLLMGIVGYALAVYFVTQGALQTTLLNVSVLSSLAPFFVLLYSFVFLKKVIKPIMLLFLIISFIGTIFVASKSFIPSIAHFGVGDIYVILSAATFAVYYFGRKLISTKLNNSEISLLVMFIAFFTSFILAFYAHESFQLSSFTHPLLLLGLIIGGGFNVVATTFENYAFQNLNAVVGSQVLLTENIFSPLAGFLFYNEMIILPQLFGATLILLGVYGSNKVAANE